MTETENGNCKEYQKTMHVMRGNRKEYGLHGQRREALLADTAQDW